MLHFPAKSQLREQTYVCMHVVPLTCACTVYVFLSPTLLVCLSGCHLIYFQVFGAVHTLRLQNLGNCCTNKPTTTYQGREGTTYVSVAKIHCRKTGYVKQLNKQEDEDTHDAPTSSHQQPPHKMGMIIESTVQQFLIVVMYITRYQYYDLEGYIRHTNSRNYYSSIQLWVCGQWE